MEPTPFGPVVEAAFEVKANGCLPSSKTEANGLQLESELLPVQEGLVSLGSLIQRVTGLIYTDLVNLLEVCATSLTLEV